MSTTNNGDTGGTAMTRDNRRPRVATVLTLLIALAFTGSSALASKPGVPIAKTESVTHIKGTNGQLNGNINPRGVETSYYFQYGLTTAYGSQTKPVAVGSGTKPVKVGQLVTGLVPGEHYRIVAVYGNPAALVYGIDKSIKTGKSDKLRFVLGHGKEEQLTVSYGGSIDLTGSLTGPGNTSHGLILQQTRFPFTAAFATTGTPILSSRTGTFLFKLSRMTANTEYRILTTDARPLYSSTVTVHVTPHIVLHARPAGKSGSYRLYGTITPARPGAFVVLQQLLPQKANSKRSGPRPKGVGTVKLKRSASGKPSSFSIVLSLSGSYRYRAYVKLPKGALESGHSNNVLVRGPKVAAKKAKKKHKHK
jgi:hypothetical protein